MTGAITWEALAYFVGLLVPITAAIIFVLRKINNVHNDLLQYKLDAADKYVQSQHLEKLERQLISSETKMIASIDALTKRLDSLIDKMQEMRSR